jgi:hypothetical protein
LLNVINSFIFIMETEYFSMRWELNSYTEWLLIIVSVRIVLYTNNQTKTYLQTYARYRYVSDIWVLDRVSLAAWFSCDWTPVHYTRGISSISTPNTQIGIF